MGWRDRIAQTINDIAAAAPDYMIRGKDESGPDYAARTMRGAMQDPRVQFATGLLGSVKSTGLPFMPPVRQPLAESDWHGISGVKLPQKFGLYGGHDIDPGPAVTKTPLDISSLKGRLILPSYSDPSVSTGTLRSVGGDPLMQPYDLRGGPHFPATQRGDPFVWASMPGAMTGLANRSNAIAEATGQSPIIMNSILGPRGMDFSHHTSWAAAQRLHASGDIAPEAAKKFDTAMKQADPNWPGLALVHRDPEAMSDWLNSTSGSGRSAFVQNQDTKWAQEGGFPAIAPVRHAVLDPDFRYAPPNTFGGTAYTIDPGARSAAMGDVHPTYSHGVTGTSLGDLGFLAPPDLIVPDVIRDLRQYGQEKNLPEYRTVGRPDYWFSGRTPAQMPSGAPMAQTQAIDQQWIDRVSKYAENWKKLGGAAALGAGATLADIAAAKEPDQPSPDDNYPVPMGAIANIAGAAPKPFDPADYLGQ